MTQKRKNELLEFIDFNIVKIEEEMDRIPDPKNAITLGKWRDIKKIVMKTK